jgi:hypothetical protein
MPARHELTERERQVLDFERCWWLVLSGTTKHDAIQERLAMSATRYYSLLDELADSAPALAYDPLVIHRIRRRRLERRRSRIVGETPRQTHPR